MVDLNGRSVLSANKKKSPARFVNPAGDPFKHVQRNDRPCLSASLSSKPFIFKALYPQNTACRSLKTRHAARLKHGMQLVQSIAGRSIW